MPCIALPTVTILALARRSVPVHYIGTLAVRSYHLQVFMLSTSRSGLSLLPILAVVLTGIGVWSGCTSFDTAIKPLVTPKAPPGYTPPIYMTGTIPASEVDPGGAVADVWRVNTNNYPDSVQLYLRLYTPQGKLLTGMAPPYWRGTGDYHTIWSGLTEQLGESGRPLTMKEYTVREFSDEDGIPYELALVVDRSGTMSSNRPNIDEAARTFINLKRPQDRIAAVTFEREPKVIVSPTDNSGLLLAAFNGEPDPKYHAGYTAIYSAARVGAEQTATSPADHPRAVVVLTDGEDNASTTTTGQLYDLCRRQNIPVFTVAFGAVNPRPLSEISNATGGRFYQTYTFDELKAAFADIYRSLRNYYVVTYKPPYVPGLHRAQLTINLPRGGAPLAVTATYNTLTGDLIAGDRFSVSDTVFFEYNSTTLRPEAAGALTTISNWLKEDEHRRIEVRGHTDAIGGEEYNQRLSDARATAVQAAIVAQGVALERVRARGFGMTMPVATNDTEEGRSRNRRVEFIILAR